MNSIKKKTFKYELYWKKNRWLLFKMFNIIFFKLWDFVKYFNNKSFIHSDLKIKTVNYNLNVLAQAVSLFVIKN